MTYGIPTSSAMTISGTHAPQSATIVTSKTTSPTENTTQSTKSRRFKAAEMITLAMGRSQSPNNSSSSDTDGFSNSPSATALRRLYFKTGRSVKANLQSSKTCKNADKISASTVIAKTAPATVQHHSVITTAPSPNNRSDMEMSSSVPKLVIMGSSVASTTETTINTSTDSASTLVTSVAATDTSEICDSLDLADTSGQSEPIFSSLEEPLLATVHIGELDHDFAELELTSSMYYRHGVSTQESTESQESSLSAHIEPTSTTPLLSHKIPRTAPITNNSSAHFVFDPPSSPKSVRNKEKNKTLFTFKEVDIFLEQEQWKPIHDAEDCQLRDHSAKGYKNKVRDSDGNHREKCCSVRDTSPNKKKMSKRAEDTLSQKHNRKSRCYEDEINNHYDINYEDEDKKGKRLTKQRTKSATRYTSTLKTSPKRERRQINSAPAVTAKDKLYNKQISPSGILQHSSRKHSSSSSSSGDRKETTMFPFDREAINFKRIERACFDVDDNRNDTSSTTSSSDGDEHNQSVYELNPNYVSTSKGLFNSCSNKNGDIFQRYTLLSQQEEMQSQELRRSKRIRPDVAHTKYLSTSDAFYPKPSSNEGDSPNVSPKTHAELNRFEDIASKFEQIPPKAPAASEKYYNGSNANISTNTINTSHNNNNNNRCSSPQNLINATSPTGSVRSKTPLPDLRVDFISGAPRMHPGSSSSSPNNRMGGSPQKLPDPQQHDNLDDCQSLTQNVAGGPINVTTNPMEAAVCTQPRATIVVQQSVNEPQRATLQKKVRTSYRGTNNQMAPFYKKLCRKFSNKYIKPSLSLDSAVETLVIKNEGDFVSVEQGKDSRKRNSQVFQNQNSQYQQIRDENMRQLLDVTNSLTFEELRDFEMRYGSPHHSRSQSVKTPGSRASGRPNQLCLPTQRSRVASMPNTGIEEEYYRLRHFSITGKGVVNRGDSLKSRRSRSNNSVASSNSSTEHLTATQIPAPNSARTSATCSLASSRESSTSNPGSGPYRVLMLGGPAVGKSSLVSQFMTSEYLHAYDTSIDDDSGEKSVSVLLSGEESELIFIDHPYNEMTPDDCLTSYDPHGYCVIYSSADRGSFTVAERVLQILWTNENIAQKAVILVGNKADLARSRHITSEEGKAMATAYDCKFIETSVGINHNVDELLVGLLSQIRLKLENPEKSRDLFRKRSTRKSKRRACSPLGGVCLTGNGGTNPNTPIGPANAVFTDVNTPPGSSHSSPRKYRGSRTSASLKVKGLLGRVWARDSKSKSCENLHVL